MAEKNPASEAEIAVHWGEEKYVYPSAEFIAQANMTDPSVFDRFSLENFPNCYKEYADLLSWYEYWQTTLDTSDAPCWKWFVSGKINASATASTASGQEQEQDRHPFRSRTHRGKIRAHHLPGAVRAGERVRGLAARFCRAEEGRSRYLAHAHGARAPTMLACARWA
jgi:hypothetical protein